jgi:hypothetical protein
VIKTKGQLAAHKKSDHFNSVIQTHGLEKFQPVVVSTHGIKIKLVLLLLKNWVKLNPGMGGSVCPLARAINC